LGRADALHCRRTHRDRFQHRRARYPPNRITSLIESCKLIRVQPNANLADVITRIVNDHPNSQVDKLLPSAYLTTQERWRVA
jgi:hypothetical protein